MSHEVAARIAPGYQARREGRLPDAKQIFMESVAVSRVAADRPALADALVGLAQVERDLKNNRAALEHYQEAADIYRAGANPLRLAHTIRHQGDILRHDGALEQARRCYEEALSLYRRYGEASPLDLANAIRGYALLREAAGEKKEARFLWQEARGLYESVNVQPGVEEAKAQIARLSSS